MNRDSPIIPVQEGEPDALVVRRKTTMRRMRQIQNNRVTPSAYDIMEVNKGLKSVKVDNGQIVITRNIRYRTMNKGGDDRE